MTEWFYFTYGVNRVRICLTFGVDSNDVVSLSEK